MSLDHVASVIDIQRALAEHARGIDRADEALLRGAYHGDGTVDYGAFGGSAAEFAQFLTPIQAGAPISLHRPSNVWCKVEGDQALSESYVVAYVVMPTDGDAQPHLVGGRYLDQHTRKDGHWRMQHRRYVLDWIVQRPFMTKQDDVPPAFSLSHQVPTGGHYTADAGNALLTLLASQRSLATEVPTMSDPSLLDKVVSHQAITELNYRYCRGVDRGDEATLLSAFHDDATVVAGVFNGPVAEFAKMIVPLLDEVSPRVAHTVTNHWIDIQGDSAVGESYVLAYQGVVGETPQDILTGGRYVDQYERRGGEWRISSRTFVMDWSMAQDGKDLINSGMFEQMVKGQRGSADPVFEFWQSLG